MSRPKRVPERVRAIASKLIEAPIHAYRRFVSPALGPRCRYEPTCSAYALDALRTHGLARGTVLAAWRVLRCNPFSHGGFDPVDAQRVFRRRRDVAEARSR